jgi:(2Fe-2S) ferredoxin
VKQGGIESLSRLKKMLKKHELKSKVMLSEVDCLDQCGRGPVFVVYPDGIWYGDVDDDCARQIVEQHIGKDRIVNCAKVLREMTAKDEGEKG